MERINVLFDLPVEISNDIAEGRFIRNGGVIADATTRQVVMWLDEAVASERVRDASMVDFVEFGASLFSNMAAAHRWKAIESRLKAIENKLQHIMGNQLDELLAEASACVDDVNRRLRAWSTIILAECEDSI